MDNLEPGQPDNSDPVEDIGQAPTDTQVVDAPEPKAPASWRDGLDPELKDHPSLANFKDPKDLAKSWVNAQKLIGKDKLVLPGKNATPQDWEQVFDKLGRPKSPEGYNIPTDYAPPELTSPEGLRDYQGIAHKLGLMPAQAEGLYKWWADQQIGVMNQMEEQNTNLQKETESTLRKEWGYAYESKLKDANRVIRQFNSEEDAQYIQGKFGNDPVMIKFLTRMGGKIAEDGIIGKGESNFLSPEEALLEISKIRANPAYLDGNNPEQKLLAARVRQLSKMAYPG